jgi:hypothetical protein
MNLTDSEFLARSPQLGLTHFADNLERWSHGRISEAAALSSCRCDEIGFDSFLRVSRQRPAHS